MRGVLEAKSRQKLIGGRRKGIKKWTARAVGMNGGSHDGNVEGGGGKQDKKKRATAACKKKMGSVRDNGKTRPAQG